MSREVMKQPEALRLADALDDEFTQGRISNHNGRKAAVELRRLHDVNQTYHEKVIPKRQWVGLTGKDIDDCYFAARTPDFDLWAFAAEIDDLLREKNQ